MVDVSTNVCCHASCARRSAQIAQPVIVAVVVAHVLGGQRCVITLAEAREHILEERVCLIAHAGQRLLYMDLSEVATTSNHPNHTPNQQSNQT